ncbi:dihydrolipoamide acetyltransferase family protein [Promicromonospora iranensis]|uniref:Dihydrolipoamide acetyltransferase component of pyruvate dehydrogenase complex n=1 Tax=Promicromonospora iranensis TaxID=1105144 RepID=A0ABU2CW27_9MICO|nr:dihydrolipoamide acetyltransferase family protein [Promicromonospora iranensis]MDR7385548.1 pyruvate dehydrogenase E2 component (dihydrolipoamide acetyltransferase) [Promicromonospora iranensis]
MTATATEQTFLLPDLGEGLTEAEVVRWLVAEGDAVAVDQPVVEVETAKSVVEVPSPYAGRVAALHAAEGDLLEVGKPLITVSAGGVGPESDPESDPPLELEGKGGSGDKQAAEAYREEERAGSGNVLIGYGTSEHAGSGRRRRPRGSRPTSPVVAATAGDRPVKVISPIVRRLAREAGLDLRAIAASGAGGVVTRSDVRSAIEHAAPASHRGAVARGAVARGAAAPSASPGAVASSVPDVPGERRIPLSGFQRTAAKVLSRSRSEIPEATVWVDVDATALWDLREASRTPADTGPGLLAHLARFVVASLKEYPVLNARLDVERDEIVEFDRINLGIAVQGEQGLVVPAVLGADEMTTVELDAALRDLVARARVGKATSEELTAGTFTLNSYGGFRVDGSAAIINHPQVAILGFGRIIDRPWVVDGEIVPRKITQMSFVFDHRVCDGGTAAGFMRSVADAIENPLAAIVRL